MSQTKLVGILNVTPDSFSDGGINLNTVNALKSAVTMIRDGVDIIDIGAESTRPGATPLSHIEEWARLAPILVPLKSMLKGSEVKLSVDTYHFQTAEKAINLGVDWINDVSGCSDENMIKVIAASDIKIVVMHNLGVPPDPKITIATDENCTKLVKSWLENKIIELAEKNISPQRIIFDPGIGFGKTPTQSIELIKNIKEFSNLRVEILVGHSRKSFFSMFTSLPAKDRDIETYIASVYLSLGDVNFLRVHDVAGNKRALNIACELFNR